MSESGRQGMKRALIKRITVGLMASGTVVLAACNEKWSSMSDQELAAKSAECLNMNDPAPAMIQVCKNYRRECERRRSNGVYVC